MTVIQDRSELFQRLDSARADARRNVEEMQALRSRLAVTRQERRKINGAWVSGYQEMIQRLQARLDSLPVIEQAKGIIMAQTGGDPDHAFDVLRRASQRSNVKVRDLAAEIVDRARKQERRNLTDSG